MRDVVILGGGLAGLTLAMQIRQKNQEIGITILEMRKNLAPYAAHKVGESTVELGTHYLREVLDLKSYLDMHHLPKQGLRFFFSPQIKEKIDERVELGAKVSLEIPSHQIDRGLFENDLMEALENMDVEIILGSRVQQLEQAEENHLIRYEKDGKTYDISSRWLVDATGRASLLKRKYQFEQEMEHNVNAVWFRIEGDIDIDKWSENAQWANKLEKGIRRLATTHFMGTGYWVWFIPLSSGVTSVGIVSDPNYHDFSEMTNFDKALCWLDQYEPLIAQKLKSYTDKILDFRKMKHLAHNSGRFYSTDKWGVVGESGAFLDPFYSPGTDFIALGNTFMSDLILRDHAGEDVDSRIFMYEQIHAAFFNSWIPIYQNQYALFGNSQLMVVKILWDWGVYWGVPCLLFSNDGFTNLNIIRKVFTAKKSIGIRLGQLNANMQKFFQEWNQRSDIKHSNYYVDFFDVPFLRKMQQELDHIFDEEKLLQQLEYNLEILEQFAVGIYQKVGKELIDLPEGTALDPYHFTLDASSDHSHTADHEHSNRILPSQEVLSDMDLIWIKETQYA